MKKRNFSEGLALLRIALSVRVAAVPTRVLGLRWVKGVLSNHAQSVLDTAPAPNQICSPEGIFPEAQMRSSSVGRMARFPPWSSAKAMALFQDNFFSTRKNLEPARAWEPSGNWSRAPERRAERRSASCTGSVSCDGSCLFGDGVFVSCGGA